MVLAELFTEPHLIELAHRSGGESIAAGLLPREVFLFYAENVKAGFC
jgi:hypothetical protein